MPKYFVAYLEATAKFELASTASLAAPSWDLTQPLQEAVVASVEAALTAAQQM